jgi:hypothetical protein
MEKFIFLFRGGMGDSRSPEDMQAEMQQWFNWIDGLRKKGIYVGGDPLERTGKQLAGKKKTITDGPFIESKEMVSGYVMITAKDIDEAVEISKSCPIFEYDGHLEVRPVHTLDM